MVILSLNVVSLKHTIQVGVQLIYTNQRDKIDIYLIREMG